MIAEIIPEIYDVVGRKVARPDLRRKSIHPSFPFGRYLLHPVSVKCSSIRDVRKFLSSCETVEDEEQFGKEDYWQPPDEFEQTRKGDCDCWSMWTWRQLLEMGYKARLVFGESSRFRVGHAWISFGKDGKNYLLEPQLWGVGERFPRLSTVTYHPRISVEWDGKRAHFYAHQARPFNLGLRCLAPLVAEWVGFWTWFWVKGLGYNLPRRILAGLLSRRHSRLKSTKSK